MIPLPKKSPFTAAGGGGGGGLISLLSEIIRRKVSATVLFSFFSLMFFCLYSLHLTGNAISNANLSVIPVNPTTRSVYPDNLNHVIREDLQELSFSATRHGDAIHDSISSVAVLLPDWEVLVIACPETPLPVTSSRNYSCLYPNNIVSPAKFAGVLPFTKRTTFKCDLPPTLRRRQPFFQPTLVKSSETYPPLTLPPTELLRWSFLAYESISTENDVVLFVKGVNRQGDNRSTDEFWCVFGDPANNPVKTEVTSSMQEVFRCRHPNLTAVSTGAEGQRIKISLEIAAENRAVPSVAYYTPRRTLSDTRPKSLMCACTMVYNVAKFLREWVMYHSKIGVEKFILYDNGSDDGLDNVVNELNQEGYNVKTLLWLWPKAQEAGFSHSAIYAKDSCTWMMYADVDEFVFSPSWSNSPQPSDQMIKSFLPRTPQDPSNPIGQVSIKCKDFGPSDQLSHPVEGVTQGYTCRRRIEERHKSIVLLDAVDHSLLNAIHHFRLREDKRYIGRVLSTKFAVVNHYKFQAWSEFKAKFRRRVSTYVVDWTQSGNLNSKDRTPGLGFEAVEPKGWAQRFCDVKDEQLKLTTRRWFGTRTPKGYKMAWQR